jgi:uncharacterized membrane protein
MNYTKMTAIVMVACLVLILIIAAYDLLPMTSSVRGDTISEITLWWWQKRPIVALLVGLVIGILFGHLGWPQDSK